MKLGDLVRDRKDSWRGKVIWTNDSEDFVGIVKISPESERGNSTVVDVNDLALIEKGESYKMVKLELDELKEVVKEFRNDRRLRVKKEEADD